MSSLTPETTHVGEVEFFSTYAKNYTEPEVVWLERIIAETGAPYSPNLIAKAVLRAGYVRSRRQIERRTCDSWCDPQTGVHAPWCRNNEEPTA